MFKLYLSTATVEEDNLIKPAFGNFFLTKQVKKQKCCIQREQKQLL